MNQEEHTIIRDFIESKSLQLLYHEKRSFAKMGFDTSNHFEIVFEGRRFIVVTTYTFYHVLTNVLAEACEKYPDHFGQDDVNKVLEALYKIENVGTFDHFIDFLKTEQFGWILELKDGKVCPNILRLELYRQLDNLKHDESKTEFTGGVFHSFKHFNFNGTPLSTKKENKEIEHPKSIIDFVIQGFFIAELKLKNKYKYESKVKFDNSLQLCFGFYREPVTGIYFLNSIRPY